MSDQPNNQISYYSTQAGYSWEPLPALKAEAGADDKRSSKPTTGSGGREFVRDNDGQFSSTPGSGAKPKPTTGRRAVDLQKRRQKPPKGRAAAKPRKGPDPAKAAEREKRRQQAAADKLKREAEQQQDKLDRAVTAEQKRRQQLADREARADATAKRRLEVEARRMKRELDKKRAQQAKPAGGGGKGGGAKKPKPEPVDTTAADSAERATNRGKVAATLGIDLGPLSRLADGGALDPQAAVDLQKRGLVAQQADGSYTTTASGRTLLRAAERGDERQARAMLQRGQELRTTADTRAAERDARQAERERTRQKPRGRNKSFVVFKDAAGADRWVASSSTSFEDKDREIVALAALEADVARTDALGDHGPLRFWHVPGWDIGDCDFRAVHGRTLIESGTFRKPEYATAIKEGDQVSLGFLHPPDQPGPDGVFTTIYTFERSITPAGRASNPFTRLAVKEVRMLTPEKRKEFEARLGPAAVAAILGEVEQTEKSADGMGVRHKGAEPERTARWDGTQWVETTKADAMPPELVDAKAEGDGGEMEELIEEPLGDEADGGSFFKPEELAEITSVVAPAVAQAVVEMLSPMLNMETKLAKWADEMKSAMGGAAATKEAADAVADGLAAQIATLKAEQSATASKLKELEGDQPAGIQGGYRASLHGPAPTGEALKSAPSVDPEMQRFFSFGQ